MEKQKWQTAFSHFLRSFTNPRRTHIGLALCAKVMAWQHPTTDFREKSPYKRVYSPPYFTWVLRTTSPRGEHFQQSVWVCVFQASFELFLTKIQFVCPINGLLPRQCNIENRPQTIHYLGARLAHTSSWHVRLRFSATAGGSSLSKAQFFSVTLLATKRTPINVRRKCQFCHNHFSHKTTIETKYNNANSITILFAA